MARRGQAVNANTSTSPSVTVPVTPIGIQVGDTILFSVNSGGGTTNTITFPTGFTPFVDSGGSAFLNVSNTNTFAAAWKIATASEPTSYTASSSVTDYLTGKVIAYSGRDQHSPIRVFGAVDDQFGSPPSFSYSLINISGILAGDDVVQLFGNRYYDLNALTYTAATGFGNAAIDYGTVQFSPVVVSEDWVAYTGGTLGLNAGTLATANTNNQGYAGFVIALALAPTPPSAATYNVPKRFGPGISPDYTQIFRRSIKGYSKPTTSVSRSLSGLVGSFSQGSIGITISGGKTIPLNGNSGNFQQGSLGLSLSTNITLALAGNAANFGQGTIAAAFGTNPFTLPYTV